jgi:signal transduction histidine kinase
MTWRRKDGAAVDVRVSGRLVHTAEDDEPSFEMMVEDVTERRALEAQLRQSQRLDALGRLARGVAHDFNNLLTVIVGSGDLIAADLGPDHPAQHELRELLNAASTAASLTQQLVAFSRQQPCRPSEVNVNAVITSMRGLLQRLVGKSVALEFALSPALLPIQADPGQIEQVVMNLAINARDAMPHGGTLTIATDASPDSVRIRIADTGVGMSEEVRSHMFEPFFTTKAIGKGSGLGLATVYGIVKQNGGEIVVASEINKGTTITVGLPTLATAHASPLEPA